MKTYRSAPLSWSQKLRVRILLRIANWFGVEIAPQIHKLNQPDR